jgi:SOS response regulatory protein OraA/RecX
MKGRKRQSTDPRHCLLLLLSSRDYSESKLSEKLMAKGFTQNDVASALLWAKESGLFNERSYITSKVRGLLSKGYAPLFIKRKLQHEKIELTLSQINDIMNDCNISMDDLIRKNINRCRGKSALQTINYMIRRGFTDLKNLYRNAVSDHRRTNV